MKYIAFAALAYFATRAFSQTSNRSASKVNMNKMSGHSSLSGAAMGPNGSLSGDYPGL